MKHLLLLACLSPAAPLATLSQQARSKGQASAPAVEAESDRVRAVAMSPEGTRIAARYAAGRVALFKAGDGEHVRDLEPPLSDTVWALEFSPDGRRLAGLGHDGMLMVWELAVLGRASEPVVAVPSSGEIVRKYNFGHSLSWSPDGARLLVGDWKGNSSLWTATGRLVAKWKPAEPSQDAQLVWSPAGDWLLSAEGSVLQVRDAKTGEPHSGDTMPRSIECGDPIRAIAIAPDGMKVATGHTDYRLRLWSLETGLLERESRFEDPAFTEKEDDVAGIAFSPNGDELALTIREGTHVFLVGVESGKQLWISEFLGAHFFEAMQIDWSPG